MNDDEKNINGKDVMCSMCLSATFHYRYWTMMKNLSGQPNVKEGNDWNILCVCVCVYGQRPLQWLPVKYINDDWQLLVSISDNKMQTAVEWNDWMNEWMNEINEWMDGWE